MEINRFKALDLQRNQIVEITTDHGSVFSKGTRLFYYDRLQEEELPEMYREGKPNVPYIELIDGKDKNGCPEYMVQLSLEDILHVFPHDMSSLTYG